MLAPTSLDPSFGTSNIEAVLTKVRGMVDAQPKASKKSPAAPKPALDWRSVLYHGETNPQAHDGDARLEPADFASTSR